ncbi:MAG: hypothetical protein ACJA1E_001593 [Paracoccaceae bacterium]
MATDTSTPSAVASSSRNGARLGGFAFGVVVMLAVGGLVSVVFTGVGLSMEPPVPSQVYTNF